MKGGENEDGEGYFLARKEPRRSPMNNRQQGATKTEVGMVREVQQALMAITGGDLGGEASGADPHARKQEDPTPASPLGCIVHHYHRTKSLCSRQGS